MYSVDCQLCLETIAACASFYLTGILRVVKYVVCWGMGNQELLPRSGGWWGADIRLDVVRPAGAGWYC